MNSSSILNIDRKVTILSCDENKKDDTEIVLKRKAISTRNDKTSLKKIKKNVEKNYETDFFISFFLGKIHKFLKNFVEIFIL